MGFCTVALFSLLALLPVLTYGCYDACIQKYSMEMDKISQSSNNSATLTTSFCRAMSNQIVCFNTAMPNCTPQQTALIQSMLTIFIQPDYQRTCGGDTNVSTTTGVPSTVTLSSDNTGMVVPGTMTTNGQTIIMCSQKIASCRQSFNQTVTSYMASYNVSGICQSLKQYTLCFVNLLSSDCGQVVPRTMVSNMQIQYGGMCSNDAQASTNSLLICTNKTMHCYVDFNATFAPAAADYNLKDMCSAISYYTTCMQTVSTAEDCGQFTSSSLSGIETLKRRHNAYCGDDGGQTAIQCVESFQDCFIPFNMTFFPAVHSANLSLLCSSLNTYTSCVTRLSPKCSRQLGQALQSAQAIKAQYTEKCHPNILKLSTCDEVAKCSHNFLQNFTNGIQNRVHHGSDSGGLCGYIGDYFPCVEDGLNACDLPQSTTEIEFGAIGKLMKGYCDRVSSNPEMSRCPAFAKCTAAIMLTFSPNIKSMFEGSAWCTYMQLSIGCAEHSLQSNACDLSHDVDLAQNIEDLDTLRVKTCEKDALGGDNLVEIKPESQEKPVSKPHGGENFGAQSSSSPLSILLMTFVAVLTRL